MLVVQDEVLGMKEIDEQKGPVSEPPKMFSTMTQTIIEVKTTIR